MASGSGNPFEQNSTLPDYTETRAKLAAQIVMGWGSMDFPIDEETLHNSLILADSFLLGSISITLQAQQDASEANIARLNELLGPPTPYNNVPFNLEEKL